MWKGLLLLVVLAGAGYLVYHFLAKGPPEERMCEKLGDLCPMLDDGDVEECTKDIRDAKKVVGEKSIAKTADCVEEADTCMEATGCMGGVALDGMEQLMKGFERRMGK